MKSRSWPYRGNRKPCLLLLCCLLLAVPAPLAVGQEFDESLVEPFANAAEQWVRENIDDDVIAAFEKGDRESVRKALQRIQQELGDDHVLDVGLLKETAKALVPVLEGYEETADYALWLKARLDYFDVAEQLRLSAPKVEPGKTNIAINPPASKEREIWIEKTSNRPWPDRAREFVPRLKPIFEAEKVAPELVWIAEVESAFDPRARSPVGAVGMFQLMPDTAKRFGLSTFPLDGRKHPGDSARASAKYLRYLHSKFRDWRLALAAYNAGEGRVQKLMTRHGATTYDEVAPYLPAETQMYVPKIEATLLRREGLRLSELRMPTSTKSG